MRNAIRYFTLTIGILLASFSLIILTVWVRVLTPEIYTEALDQSDIYSQVTEITQDYIAFGVGEISSELADFVIDFVVQPEEGEDPTVIQQATSQLIREVVTQNTSEFINTAIDQEQFESNLQLITETTIDNVLAWLRGDIETPEEFSYIPTTQELEFIEEKGVVRLVMLIVADQIYSFSSLPQCTSQEQEVQNLQVINSGNLEGITCMSPVVRPVVIQEIETIVPADLLVSIETAVEELLVTYNIQPMIDGIFDILHDIAALKEAVVNVRSDIIAVKNAGLAMLVFSLFFLGIGFFASRGVVMRTFLWIGTLVGLTMVFASVVYRNIIAPTMLDYIDFNSMSLANEVISPAQSAIFVVSVASTVSYMVYSVFDYTMWLGVAIVLVTGIPLVAHSLYKITKKDSRVALTDENVEDVEALDNEENPNEEIDFEYTDTPFEEDYNRDGTDSEEDTAAEKATKN